MGMLTTPPLHPTESGQFRYRTIKIIGRGGFGVVEKIEVIFSRCDLTVGKPYALKRLNERYADDYAANERLKREIDALQRLNHPSIVTIRGHSLPSRTSWYVMDLYSHSLRDWIHQNSSTPWAAVVRCGVHLAHAMSHAHGIGILHRDLKPENILLRNDGTPVISDWGLTQLDQRHPQFSDRANLTQGGIGTAYYCSARQAIYGKAGPQDDIYSLGMLLDELWYGKRRPLRHIGDGLNDFTPPRCQRDAVTDLLVRMTARDGRRRLNSMSEVLNRLLSMVPKTSRHQQ